MTLEHQTLTQNKEKFSEPKEFTSNIAGKLNCVLDTDGTGAVDSTTGIIIQWDPGIFWVGKDLKSQLLPWAGTPPTEQLLYHNILFLFNIEVYQNPAENREKTPFLYLLVLLDLLVVL